MHLTKLMQGREVGVPWTEGAVGGGGRDGRVRAASGGAILAVRWRGAARRPAVGNQTTVCARSTEAEALAPRRIVAVVGRAASAGWDRRRSGLRRGHVRRGGQRKNWDRLSILVKNAGVYAPRNVGDLRCVSARKGSMRAVNG